MNRRRFLTGLTTAFAVAPIAAKLAAVKPVTVTLADIVTPEVLAPYQQAVADSVAKYWSQKMNAAFVTHLNWGKP